jgi:excisionase family DNA binding protein
MDNTNRVLIIAPDGTQYITPDYMAYLIGVDTMTIYRKIKAGKLGAQKIGGEYRISEADYAAFTQAPLWPGKQIAGTQIEA